MYKIPNYLNNFFLKHFYKLPIVKITWQFGHSNARPKFGSHCNKRVNTYSATYIYYKIKCIRTKNNNKIKLLYWYVIHSLMFITKIMVRCL